MKKVVIPYKPRPLQMEVHQLMEKKRFVVAVCHRRFGKSVLAVNAGIKGAVTCPLERPRFAYVGPTYRQAKSTAWDYMTHFSRPIPGVKINQAELRIDYPNGGQFRIFGADNPDALRGMYFDGIIIDEFGMCPPKTFSEVVTPALTDRKGWALILGTPNGKNEFYKMFDRASSEMDPDWGARVYKASETGYLDQEELDKARKSMTKDEYNQEFECDFAASVRGAIYGEELEDARNESRITSVPYDPALPVDTDWDLGVGDSTAIWFSQSLRSGEVHLIDYYESSGEGFPHYAKVLDKRGYVYGTHWAPHDIMVREMGTGKSRLDIAGSYGIKFQVTPRIHGSKGGEVEEGIHAVRMLIAKCWFDAKKCSQGLEGLMSYRRAYNLKLKEYTAQIVHDSASHPADAFRGLAVRHKNPVEKKKYRNDYIMPDQWVWA